MISRCDLDLCDPFILNVCSTSGYQTMHQISNVNEMCFIFCILCIFSFFEVTVRACCLSGPEVFFKTCVAMKFVDDDDDDDDERGESCLELMFLVWTSHCIYVSEQMYEWMNEWMKWNNSWLSYRNDDSSSLCCRFFVGFGAFLANVNSSSCSLFVIGRPSVCLSSVCLSVCNVRAPYSGDWNFRQCFYAIWYAGHLLTSR